jgi:hypothetical protein
MKKTLFLMANEESEPQNCCNKYEDNGASAGRRWCRVDGRKSPNNGPRNGRSISAVDYQIFKARRQVFHVGTVGRGGAASNSRCV